jgi:hypothetical protein
MGGISGEWGGGGHTAVLLILVVNVGGRTQRAGISFWGGGVIVGKGCSSYTN